jgi:hypothetical protein
LFSLPRGTKMFQFPRLPPELRPKPYLRSHRITGVGLPHSGILGSKLVRSSPRHIAVHRALHRLFAPRHPPVALGSLTVCSQRMSLTLRSHCSLPGLAGKPASPGKANKARLYSLMHTQIIRSAVFKAPHPHGAPSGTRRRGVGITPSDPWKPNILKSIRKAVRRQDFGKIFRERSCCVSWWRLAGSNR